MISPGPGIGPDLPEDTILLVDGMSLLVRSAKAAEKMPHLSYCGVMTGTLTVFMNSLTKRLTGAFDTCPTHAVICWEGDPAKNWRYEYFPGYRKSRIYATAAPQDSDLGLARGFCAAAGLYQDSMPEFEGDDMVASWWRLACRERPDSPVVIVSSDADLLQLADKRTVIWGASGDDIYSAGVVHDMYGCEPGQVALVRALAGDVSDEIPGLRGTGLSRAAGLVQQAGGDRENVFKIVAELAGNPDEGERIRNYWTVMELREAVHRPEDLWIGQLKKHADQFVLASWRPWHQREAMEEFLEKYGMNRMLSRLHAGSLPWSGAI